MASPATPPPSAGPSNPQADALFAAAAKKEAPSMMASIFGGGAQRLEEAADGYSKAANLYKMSKQPDEAGHAFTKAAECYLRAGSKADASTALMNAANAFRKSSPPKAVHALEECAKMNVADGRFSMAAKHYKDIAEIQEAELNMDGAIEAFQQAADFYEGENAVSSTNQCLLKVALFSAQQEKYERAIEIFERIATTSLENNLLKWGAKDNFFRAALCHLATGDMISAKRAVERYQDQDPSFAGSRECKFLLEIIAAVEAFDIERFTAASIEFDSITKLDAWKTTLLLRIKNQIREGGDLT